MSLLKRLAEKTRSKEQKKSLMSLFLELEGSSEFPYEMALSTYENLKQQSQNKTEFLAYLLEDIVYSSLYATYYEEILNTIHLNPEVALPLINQFSEDQESRDQEVAEQTYAHVEYIINKGQCQGCAHCEHHVDVNDLVGYWQKQDLSFFSTLYLGMQTIQFSMEHVLYDVLPTEIELSEIVARKALLNFRQEIYEDVEKRLLHSS